MSLERHCNVSVERNAHDEFALAAEGVAQGEPKAAGDGARELHDLHFDWRIIANGRLYRVVMRITHRLGWCYPEPTDVEPGFVWCHWCGMRGRR